MGTKSELITSNKWLSMLKTKVVSTDVLMTRKRYFLPYGYLVNICICHGHIRRCTNLGHSHVEPLTWEAASKVSYDCE